jgi:hypothetical protein
VERTFNLSKFVGIVWLKERKGGRTREEKSFCPQTIPRVWVQTTYHLPCILALLKLRLLQCNSSQHKCALLLSWEGKFFFNLTIFRASDLDSVAAAAFTFALKEGVGPLGGILFASRYGKNFDEDIKKWRFMSTVAFNIALYIELMTLQFPS